MVIETQGGQAAGQDDDNTGTVIEGEAAPAGAPEAGQEADETPPEIAALAQEIGWVPRDQYRGPPENWKDAAQFIRDGRNIQTETSRELKSVKTTLENIARTTGGIVEQQVAERTAELRRQHAELVEAGDSDGALRVASEIGRVSAAAPINTPPPEATDFATRNASWFNKPGSEWATSKAVEVCNALARQGYGPADQLRICEQRMKEEHPGLFGLNGQARKAPAAVATPGGRSAPPGNRAKGFADLPKAAQDIALDLESRLKVPKENYAKNYFANETGKA